MEQREIVRQVWEHLEPELSRQGYELVEVEYGRQGGSSVLRLFIDKEGGINIDDCAEVSRYVSPLLDVENYIADSYTLEVSSPGIERPIRKPEDFIRFAGEQIKLRTIAPVHGRKRFKGVLRGYADGLVSVEEDGETHNIHIENLKKALLDR